jgi:hypothetical protein
MTTPADIRRLIHRAINSLTVAEHRLQHAETNTQLLTAIGHPTTASGNTNHGPRGTNELTLTEAAAHTNLGDIYGYTDGTRDANPDIDTHTTGYHPGPTTRYNDIADPIRAALKALDHMHTALTDAGVPPFITEQHRCRGINATGCTDWADRNRTDHLCIDCGRRADQATRAQRDRARYHSPHS